MTQLVTGDFGGCGCWQPKHTSKLGLGLGFLAVAWRGVIAKGDSLTQPDTRTEEKVVDGAKDSRLLCGKGVGKG